MAATVIEKDKLVYEDIHFDTQGTGQTVQKLKSDGTYRTGDKVNASHVPITSTCRAKKQASGAAIGTTDVDGTLVQVLDDLEDLGQPDASTLENSAGSLRIKDLGVATAKLAANAVTFAKMLQSTAQKCLVGRAAATAGDFAEIAPDDVSIQIDTTLKVKNSGINADRLATDAVETAKIKDSNVTVGKLAWVPSHYVVKAGTATLTGGAASEAEAVAGVLDTDVVIATGKTITNAVYLKLAVPTADTITFTFSADPGAATIYYCVLRGH